MALGKQIKTRMSHLVEFKEALAEAKEIFFFPSRPRLFFPPVSN